MTDPGARAGRPWTVRVAAWSAGHRWLAFGLWCVVTLGLFGGSLLNGGIRTLDVNQDCRGSCAGCLSSRSSRERTTGL